MYVSPLQEKGNLRNTINKGNNNVSGTAKNFDAGVWILMQVFRIFISPNSKWPWSATSSL
jgi:hypothetical protein